MGLSWSKNVKLKFTIFSEETTSAIAGFHAGPLSWSKVEEGKPENPEKNPRGKARTNNKLNLGHIGVRRALLPLYHPCSFDPIL